MARDDVHEAGDYVGREDSDESVRKEVESDCDGLGVLDAEEELDGVELPRAFFFKSVCVLGEEKEH